MPLWGNTSAANNKPQYLSTDEKTATSMVDAAASEISHTNQGWELKTTYTGVGGVARVKSETLVALGSATIVV